MRYWNSYFKPILVAGVAGLFACTPHQPTGIERGKTVYQTTCIACHNSNPTKPGPVGPEIAGASRALIEARILHAGEENGYPKGYTPKRNTKLMRPLPQVLPDLEAVFQYLNSF